jgi:hypothetical protein
MLLSLFLFAAIESVTLYTGPRPEETVVYNDWITGCDNVRNCSAIVLQATDTNGVDRTDHLEILIEQPLAHHRDPLVTIKVSSRPDQPDRVFLSIDGKPVKLPPLLNGRLTFSGVDARGLLKTMRAGAWMELRDGGDLDIARASLRGLTAALLRIDEQQGKVGTPRALARPGRHVPYDDLPGYSVSLSRPAPSDRPPMAPDAKAMAALRGNDQCDAERSAQPRIIRLDSDNSMVIMPWQCGNGAYNLYSNIMIVNGFGETRPALFDYDNGITGDGPSNVLVNVSWDDEKRVLEGFVRHRGIGDCGRVDRYIWGGEKFMLSEQFVMPECRMAFDRIRTWKVDVVDR